MSKTTTPPKPAPAPAPVSVPVPAPTPSHGGRYKRAEDGTLTPIEE